MQICPSCANELGDLDIICASCGHVVGVRGPALSAWSGFAEDPNAASVVAAHVAATDAELAAEVTSDITAADPPHVTSAEPDVFQHVQAAVPEHVPAAVPEHVQAAVPEHVADVGAAEPRAVPGAAAPKQRADRTKQMGTSRNTILVAAAIGAAAAVVFIVRSTRSNAQTSSLAGAAQTAPSSGARTSTVQAAASRNTAARSPAGVAAQPQPTSEPKWSRTRQLQWGSDGSRIIGFELPAERDVSVYMDRVRPTLAVRCTSRQTEVFVVLRTAASIESGSDTHAVRIGLDDQPDVEERWQDSSDMQALFAPDGKTLMARMATARRLRFGFKPFNATPAVVEFDVHGFDGPLAAMSKVCGSPVKRGPSPRG